MISLVLLERKGGTERITCFSPIYIFSFSAQTISFKSYMPLRLDQRMYLFLHCIARDAPNLFPPVIYVKCLLSLCLNITCILRCNINEMTCLFAFGMVIERHNERWTALASTHACALYM